MSAQKRRIVVNTLDHPDVIGLLQEHLAHALYLRFGFVYRGPFTLYRNDPFSQFMRLLLVSND